MQFETRKCIKNKSLSKDNIINSLGLQFDEDKIIRCYGRFTNAINMPEETKKPIYVPKKEHSTTLLIKEFHERLLHAGTSHALSQMRYINWIPQGQATVKAAIYQCGVCRKYNGGPYKMPKLADWPKEKISKAALFTYTGLDYIVAFYVKENEEKKVWICIFTCVTVRAVHLEIVYGMKAEQFFMALQRFISRRNTPDTIILDNVPQFKLTKTTLDKAWQQPISHENMQRFTSHVRIKWKFIIEFSPWMGGFYERLVGMVKSSLRKVIQIKFLTTTQFRTYAIECEHILNSRLLVYIDDDISSTEAIKPNHFLCLNPQNLAPILEDDGNPDFKPQMESSNELLEIWRKGQSYLNEFWKHWYNHYLLSSRE